MEKLTTLLGKLPNIGRIVALVLYIIELFCLAAVQDWFFSREFTGVWIVVGANILVYLIYVAWEIANVMIYHWMHGASLIKVLLSPIKVLTLWYVFWRIYTIVNPLEQNDEWQQESQDGTK